MATEVTLVLLFEQDEDDLDLDEIIATLERAFDCVATEWDSQEV